MRRELWVDGVDLSYEWEKKQVKNLNLRGTFCGDTGTVVPQLCPVEYSQTDAAHPQNDQPVGQLPTGNGGDHHE